MVLNQGVTEKGFGVCDSVSPFSHGPGIGTEDCGISAQGRSDVDCTARLGLSLGEVTLSL